MLAHGPAGETLVLVAGRQIQTLEGLEALALGTDSEFPDGLELTAALAEVRASGALAVLPWGFGKWWFRRGQLARKAIDSAAANEFFLGDNRGSA